MPTSVDLIRIVSLPLATRNLLIQRSSLGGLAISYAATIFAMNPTLQTIEPWRAKAFPVVKDLVIDRSAFDRVIAAGGYVSVNCGGAPDGNAILISKDLSEAAMDSAACIGCGACVAACKNASAHLFMSSKISHLALLPQGQLERRRRVVAMIEQADAEGFGSCSNEGECEAVCPKEIPISNIARMTREYVKALLGA